ncbi:MBL fold metallo-hydrolase [Natrinema caseinilyticum]|uniref:MBL fold metallo-hydrolase n=1 Tax=Natrinema caseinilyticum TaxID=2961570 RepID=UPI0020C23F80|nr:MBL fold metallo-hydrolase [Natrinema caseinilyticum]
MDTLERVPIPTPFSVGRVNCYLFTGAGLTVVDPGPATEEASEELRTALARIDSRIADVDRVLITHPHMDHFGLAGRIVEESGAQVFAHEDAATQLSDPIGYFEREQQFFEPFLLSMGMPADTVDTVLELPEPYTNYQDPVAVTDEVAEGDVVDIGVDLECISTPGHAPGSMCYYAAAEDAMLTGDHVLPDITPNPLLTLVPGTDDERTRSLPTYLESLRHVLAMDVSVGYGGHGDPMPDLEAPIRETISHHQDRKERIAGLVADDEPATAYEIMKAMFPDLPATEMFPGMSEVIGHLDLLEDEGRVVIEESDGVKRYELETNDDGSISDG